MSALTPEDRHIVDMIEQHTTPLRSNAASDRMRIDELESQIRVLRQAHLETIALLRKYLKGLVK